MSFNLFANGFNGCTRAEEAVGQRLILPKQPQQQVFSLDAWAAELTGFITGEKDHPAGLVGITFKHNSCPGKVLRKKDRMRKRLGSACRTPSLVYGLRGEQTANCGSHGSR